MTDSLDFTDSRGGPERLSDSPGRRSRTEPANAHTFLPMEDVAAKFEAAWEVFARPFSGQPDSVLIQVDQFVTSASTRRTSARYACVRVRLLGGVRHPTAGSTDRHPRRAVGRWTADAQLDSRCGAGGHHAERPARPAAAVTRAVPTRFLPGGVLHVRTAAERAVHRGQCPAR